MATSAIQVIPYHNCKGCKDKVKKAFRKLKGVELTEIDPEIGKFTFAALGNPEAIRAALEKKFRKKLIVLLPGPPPPPPPPSTTEPSAPPMPTSPEEDDYVIGYPIDSYHVEDDYAIGYPVID